MRSLMRRQSRACKDHSRASLRVCRYECYSIRPLRVFTYFLCVACFHPDAYTAYGWAIIPEPNTSFAALCNTTTTTSRNAKHSAASSKSSQRCSLSSRAATNASIPTPNGPTRLNSRNPTAAYWCLYLSFFTFHTGQFKYS